MRELAKWEIRIDTLLRRCGHTIDGAPEAYSNCERELAKCALRESGLLTIDYMYRLKSISLLLEFALSGEMKKTNALLEIVRRSPVNCQHCLNARLAKSHDCEEDYDCVICKETECPCKICKNGSHFTWETVPGDALKALGYMQEPLELYPDKYVPMRKIVHTLLVFIELRHSGEIAGGLYIFDRDIICISHEDYVSECDNEGQGRTWRAWLTYPTKEEREAAPWKELLDEGLTEEELQQ